MPHIFDNPILLILTLPLIAAAAAATIRHANIRDGILVAISLLLIWQTVSLARFPSENSITLLPFSSHLGISFYAESIGLIFACLVSILWCITTLYAIGYMRANKQTNQTRFFTFFSLSIFATLAIAFSENLLTLFIFYELLTLSTYPLVAHKGSEEAKHGARIYLFTLMGTSLLLFFPALLLTYHFTGTLTFTAGGIFDSTMGSVTLVVLCAMYMFGIGKAALMPFHRWLPAAMVAPTPVSALLHAVAVVKAGVFSIIKIILYIFGLDVLTELNLENHLYTDWLIYISGATIILASTIALKQDAIKRRLAYSTISQLSYIVMIAAVFTPKALMAATFHMVGHAFAKITLFFGAGAIYTAHKKQKVSELKGIGYAMPFTMAAFTVAVLSMIAIPPSVGFLSKWFMMSSAYEQQSWHIIGILLLSTLLNAGYFLPILYRAYQKPNLNKTGIKEAPLMMVIALTVTMLVTLFLFFNPNIVLNAIHMSL